MVDMLARNWWVLLIRGIAALLFGIAAFLWPGLTLVVLVLLFGAYAFVDGIFAVISGIAARKEERRWWVIVLEGLVGIVVGVVTFLLPSVAALALIFFIAVWAILTGILEIAAAIRLRKEIQGEWMLALAGILSIIFGILLVVLPSAGALALVWLIGAYSLVFGILFLILAFRLRSWQHNAGSRQVPGTA